MPAAKFLVLIELTSIYIYHEDLCSGSVGCDCTGFEPITNGTVAQEAFCRKCGHHRRYHKRK